jgi:signal transduction histidine kinase
LGDPSAYPLEASAKFNTAMRQARTRQHALEILTEQCALAFRADAVGIYDLHDGMLQYALGRGLSIPPPPSQPTGGDGVLSQAINAERILQFDTTGASPQDCDFCAFLHAQGMQTLLVTALRTSQEIVGVLFLALRLPRRLAESEEQLLLVFSEAAGSTLHRFQITDQLEHSVANREAELQLLYDLMAIAGENADMNELLPSSLRRILRAAGCAVGLIHFADPANHRIRGLIRENIPDEFLVYLEISGWSEELWARVYREDVVVQVRNLSDRSSPEHPIPERKNYNYLGIPIHIKNIAVGALSLFGADEHILDPAVVQMVSSAAVELGLAVESAHFRQQAEDAVVLRERQRLARNLHDSVSQSLYALVLSADVSEKLLRIKDFPGLRQELRDIGNVALHGLKEMRLMLFELRPVILENTGLLKALELRLNTVEARSGIEASLNVEGSLDLTPAMEQELYRIAIEALNNSLKHASASTVKIALSREPERVVLAVQDDGSGFDPADTGAGGLGLDSMRERAHTLGGELIIQSSPGAGTLVHLEIPLPRKTIPQEEGSATPTDPRPGR